MILYGRRGNSMAIIYTPYCKCPRGVLVRLFLPWNIFGPLSHASSCQPVPHAVPLAKEIVLETRIVLWTVFLRATGRKHLTLFLLDVAVA